MRNWTRFAATGLLAGGLVFAVAAQSKEARGAKQATAKEAPADSPAPRLDMGDKLIAGLQSTEGCLGVDSGQMRSGKNVIMAWFRDKEAVKRWYYHPTHQGFMGMVKGRVEREPLTHAPDGVPIMVIASITPAAKPQLAALPMPISQISIELFVAAPGGAHINGRLAPATFEVPHMYEYTQEAP